MMPSTSLAHEPTKSVARPLKVLVPLIKEDLREGDEAAKAAAMPYYRAAGEKMVEAKAQLARGEFMAWVKRNFAISQTQANRYMSYATATNSMQINRARDYESLSDFVRESGGSPRGSARGGATLHETITPIINKVNVEALNREHMRRAEERDAERKLALQLIDIGYKALATKLHPDRGGSREAMARLNQVRDRLKASA